MAAKKISSKKTTKVINKKKTGRRGDSDSTLELIAPPVVIDEAMMAAEEEVVVSPPRRTFVPDVQARYEPMQQTEPETFESPVPEPEAPEEEYFSESETPDISNRISKDKRQAILWFGVGFVMLIMIIGWLAFLPSTLALPKSKEDTDLKKINDQFTNLFVNVGQQLDQLKNNQTASTTSTAPATPSTPTLSPEAAERLRQNVLGATTTKNDSPPTSTTTVHHP